MVKPPVDGHYSFLLIEDNPLDAELTADRLRIGGLNFDLEVVDNRAGFERAFATKRFDLILADYSLPDFDGRSALAIVRANDPRIPFVFVSGVLGEDVAVETLLAGATDYVLKQKMDRLLPAVIRALTEHDAFKSRERAETELKKGAEQFVQLTNRLPAMVWTCDLDGTLTFTNSLWQSQVGPANNVFEPSIIHPNDLARCQAAWENAQRTHRAFELDCRYRVTTGEYRWQLVWAAPVEDDQHRLTGWVGTCTDTEQQRLRDIQIRTAEKLASTGRLASVIAHEINNPLEAMINLVYLLRDTGDVEERQRFLSLLEHELMRISAITKLTLQWSREENSAGLLSARKLLEETVGLFRGKLTNKDITVSLQIAHDVEFRGVGGEIRQVLANLLSNAIDAVSVGGRICCTVRRVVKNDTLYVEFSVEDNGCGIAPERIPGIFVPFHSTKGNLGNGLGLYISKEIVDRHRGDLKIESEIDAGTNMSVLLPVA